MDTAAFLKLLAGAGSAGQVGVPVTQAPRSMATELPAIQRQDAVIAANPRNAERDDNGDILVGPDGWGAVLQLLQPLFKEYAKAKQEDPQGVSGRETMRKDATIPQNQANIAATLRNILQRDTGRK